MPFPTTKKLCFSLLVALAAANAQAVHISPTGTGQALLFPIYTVRDGFSTLVSVTNTQDNIKAVKVRFMEGMAGRTVFTFNLYLAANDTWTGAVVETLNGARIITNDSSCVTPSDLFAEVRKLTVQPLNEFVNGLFTGPNQDNPQFSTLDRTREGYFEFLEMAVIDPTLSPTAAQISGFVKRDIDNVVAPAYNCAGLDSFESLSAVASPIRFPNTGAAMMVPPSGGLKGRASLINATTGANYSYVPTTLDGWSSQVAYSQTGSFAGTRLTEAFPPMSMVTTSAGVVTARWANGRDAVSAVLMRDSLINEFVLDKGTASQTDWVVTLPTQPFYIDPINIATITASRAPFSFACDSYLPSVLSREANPNAGQLIFPGVKPPAPEGAGQSSTFCRTANVIPFLSSVLDGKFIASGLLSSTTPTLLAFYNAQVYVISATSTSSPTTTPSLSGTQGPNGRLTMRFMDTQQKLTPLSATLTSQSGVQSTITGTHFGLPMIGFMLHNYKNANVVSRYGGIVEHAYTVRVE